MIGVSSQDRRWAYRRALDKLMPEYKEKYPHLSPNDLRLMAEVDPRFDELKDAALAERAESGEMGEPETISQIKCPHCGQIIQLFAQKGMS